MQHRLLVQVTNYTIPISTPFALTGSATDANAGDVLTYCWEQNDNASSGKQAQAVLPVPTKATGPNWLSFLRYHITNSILSQIINNPCRC